MRRTLICARLWPFSFALLCSAAALFFTMHTGAAPKFGPHYAKPFSLTDHNGRAFTRRGFEGMLSLVFFGYSHCPDVCPLTLSVMKDVHRLLDERGVDQASLQYIFVSVDPDRDTPAQLARYVKYYGNFLLGVTGETDDIERLVVACAAYYEFNDPDEKGNYTVSHTASIALVGPDGVLLGVYPERLDAGAISDSLVEVMQ